MMIGRRHRALYIARSEGFENVCIPSQRYAWAWIYVPDGTFDSVQAPAIRLSDFFFSYCGYPCFSAGKSFDCSLVYNFTHPTTPAILHHTVKSCFEFAASLQHHNSRPIVTPGLIPIYVALRQPMEDLTELKRACVLWRKLVRTEPARPRSTRSEVIILC